MFDIAEIGKKLYFNLMPKIYDVIFRKKAVGKWMKKCEKLKGGSTH